MLNFDLPIVFTMVIIAIFFVLIQALLGKLSEDIHSTLTLFFRMFPFNSPENIRKPSVS